MSTVHPAPLFWGSDPSLSLNFLTKPALNCPSFRKQSGVKWFAQPGINELMKVKCDMWPSVVTHTRNLCSAFKPSKCTHTVVNTHHEHTPGAVGSHIVEAPGVRFSWGFGDFLKSLTSVIVLKVEESAGYSLLKSKWLDNWDCLGFGGIKKRSFYNCMVVVLQN